MIPTAWGKGSRSGGDDNAALDATPPRGHPRPGPPRLGEIRPVDIMDTSEGAEAVEDLLVRILHGGIA